MSRGETLPRPLRVGILVHPDQAFEQWEQSLFERLDRHPALSLAAFVELPSQPRKNKPSLLFRAISAIDKQLFARSSRPAVSLSDEKLRHIPVLSADALKQHSCEPDILISHVQAGSVSEEMAFGGALWEYHFNTDNSGQPGLFGFRESLEGIPATRSALLQRKDDGSQELIADCISNTKFSAAWNAFYAKDKLPALVERELLRVAQNGGKLRSPKATPPIHESLQFREPGPADLLKYVAHLAANIGHRLANALFGRIGGRPNRWSLVVSKGDVLSSPLENFRELLQPKGEYRADPFLFEKDGENFVFFEAWSEGSEPARICVGRIDGDTITDVENLDFGDNHISYPYVFEHGGDIFMIPETFERSRVEVWRCTEFPGKWSLHSTALEGHSPADTVMLEWDDRWWLLTNLSTGKIVDHCMELHVYRVDGPNLNLLEPHPLNPVVLDTTRARNGGRPFVRDGRLIRPAQVTSHGLYGFGLVLMEVTDLSMSGFSEREIKRIEPDRTKATTGCHHLDSSGDLFIMDVRRAYGSRLLGARPIALKAS